MPKCSSNACDPSTSCNPREAGSHVAMEGSCQSANNSGDVANLCKFVEYGIEGSIVLLQACLDQVKFQSEDFQSKPDLLSAIFRYFLGRPNFATVFCEALRSKVISEVFLEGLSKQLHLSTPEKIVVGLALSDSGNTDFKIRGQNFCMAHIEELCTKPASEEKALILAHRKEIEETMEIVREILSDSRTSCSCSSAKHKSYPNLVL
ncbi:uncharacterized protein LOC131232324 [Magnolia sinica]|uniref:uncharacterized protein LOC131232324 n=1 Tax=Magnolia sinica TaxID=86752 RepID=UPI002658C01A|nr:uncharacterized protein LOC131232324 [Magnolia sinica]